MNEYSHLAPATRIAMHFIPGGPVGQEPEGSLHTVEDLQMQSFARINQQSRADLLRRADAAIKRVYGDLPISPFWCIRNASNQWCSWDLGPSYTDDYSQALRFARRDDAERFCTEDEDAWSIVQIIDNAGQRIEGQPVSIREREQKREAAAKDLATRIARVIRAPADVWAVGDLLPLLAELGTFLAFFSGAGEAVHAGQLPEPKEIRAGLDPLPDGMMLPVDRYEAKDVLRLARAFMLRNCSVWEMGAGDHHHPIWEMMALNIDGPDPTFGPEYAFISPRNRQRLSVLLKIEEEKRLEEANHIDAGGGATKSSSA
jgi:hypothetical protein